MRHIALTLVLLLGLVGCRMPGTMPPITQTTKEAVPAAESKVLEGRVEFPSERKAQATMTDVAVAATVSLINTGTNQTVASTVTDTAGAFRLSFPNGFKPDPTVLYYLEAFKGLSSNMPGHNAARVRTIAKFNGGWTTLTNALPNVGIVVNPMTTGVSIGAALKNGNPTPFDFNSLIGSVTGATPSVYIPVTGLTQPDATALLDLVNQALANDRDPVAEVGFDGTNWIPVSPSAGLSVTSLNPTSGAVGSTVTVTGMGFSTTPGNNIVRFNGVPATATAATGTHLTVTVPSGATSGQTTVQVGNTVYLGPSFTVSVALTSFSPASGSAGTSV
ncbi:MAG TPA: IPT/TIG domain-containing protein, partial [Stenomitos sp.]